MVEIDRSRPTANVGGVFGSGHAFNASPAAAVPPELVPLVKPQLAVAKAQQPMKTSLNTANTDYGKLADPATTGAPLPVQAARLNGLLKTLANAEGAVTQCIQARRDLIRELEKILATNRDALDADERQMMELSGRRTEVEQKRQTVERAIVGGLTTEELSSGGVASGTPLPEPDRPQVEALTPPHVQDHVDDFYGGSSTDHQAENGQPQPPLPLHDASAQPAAADAQPGFPSSAPGIEMLSNLASHYQAVPLNGSSKKRKIEAADEFPDLGGDDGIDADVKEMLRKDSQSA